MRGRFGYHEPDIASSRWEDRVISDTTYELEPGRHAPGHARRLVRAACTDWSADDVHTALVLTSELVTNAILHTPGEVSIRVARHGVLLTVEVLDIGDGDVQQQPPSSAAEEGSVPMAESGRGLTLVEALADRWGVRMNAYHNGKAVWFELRPRG